MRKRSREMGQLKRYIGTILGRTGHGGALGHIDVFRDGTVERLSAPEEVAKALVDHAPWLGQGRKDWYLNGKAKDFWDPILGKEARKQTSEGALNLQEWEIPHRFEHVVRALQTKRKPDGGRITESDDKDMDKDISFKEWEGDWNGKRGGRLRPCQMYWSI